MNKSESLARGNYSWIVKVWDLLTQPGSDDLISRSNQAIETFPNITSDNLDITMKIVAVNHHEVWITIIWLRCSFNETCDYSGQEYIRTLEIVKAEQETLRFAHKSYDDEVYSISTRDNTINILDPITQLIKLHEPVSKVAPWYEFLEDDSWYDDESAVNRVVFK